MAGLGWDNAMGRYLLPGAVVLAAVIGGISFRYDLQPIGHQGVGLMVHDRWSGTVKICEPHGKGYSNCFAYLAAGRKAIPRPSAQ